MGVQQLSLLHLLLVCHLLHLPPARRQGYRRLLLLLLPLPLPLPLHRFLLLRLLLFRCRHLRLCSWDSHVTITTGTMRDYRRRRRLHRLSGLNRVRRSMRHSLPFLLPARGGASAPASASASVF